LKILVIGYLHKKHDKRVFRTVLSLSKKHEIIYQYRCEKFEEPYFENNIRFIPVYYIRDKTTPPLKELFKRRNFDYEIMEIIKKQDKLGKVVVYDIHEYHPYNFLAGLTGIKKKIKERIMFKIFRKQLEYSDKLIFVSPEVKEDIFQTLNIERDVLIVPNYAAKEVKSNHKNKEIVLVGSTKRYLNKEKVILKRLIKLGWKFKVIGMDSDFLEDIEHTSTSFLPYDDMLVELSKVSFSLISYDTIKNDSDKNAFFALPNKYYDSIAAETPVIVNKHFISMAKEVEKFGIGVVIDTNKPDEAVRKILKAYDNYETLIENIRKHKDRLKLRFLTCVRNDTIHRIRSG